MATCDLFGVLYECPEAGGTSSQWGSYDFSAWSNWQIGDPTPSGVPATQAEGGQAPSVNDVVAVGSGLVGIVMSIVQGVASIKSESGAEVEAPAAQVPVLSAPAAPTGAGNGETDWLPIVIGGGVLLVLMMGMRR